MHESLKLSTGVWVTRISTKGRHQYVLSLSLSPSWSHLTLSLTPYYRIIKASGATVSTAFIRPTTESSDSS